MCLGLAPVPTPEHASVEAITSLQSAKKILLQLYGITKATLAVFSTSSLFFVTVTGRAAPPPPVNPPEGYRETKVEADLAKLKQNSN